MFKNLFPVEQGSIGLTAAIFYLSKLGYNISIPLIDNQNYDLIIEDKETKVLYKVEIKTSGATRPSGSYAVQIKSVRSNKTGNKIKSFDNTSVDFLFILLSNNDKYFIPANKITTKSEVTLPGKFKEYLLED